MGVVKIDKMQQKSWINDIKRVTQPENDSPLATQPESDKALVTQAQMIRQELHSLKVMEEMGILVAQGGKVRLRKHEEYAAVLGGRTEVRHTVWEVTQR